MITSAVQSGGRSTQPRQLFGSPSFLQKATPHSFSSVDMSHDGNSDPDLSDGEVDKQDDGLELVTEGYYRTNDILFEWAKVLDPWPVSACRIVPPSQTDLPGRRAQRARSF